MPKRCEERFVDLKPTRASSPFVQSLAAKAYAGFSFRSKRSTSRRAGASDALGRICPSFISPLSGRSSCTKWTPSVVASWLGLSDLEKGKRSDCAGAAERGGASVKLASSYHSCSLKVSAY